MEVVDLLHAAGFTFCKWESSELVRSWRDYSGKRVTGAWHELDHQWKYLASFGEELSPVFADVGLLLTWMRVEGWIA